MQMDGALPEGIAFDNGRTFTAGITFLRHRHVWLSTAPGSGTMLLQENEGFLVFDDPCGFGSGKKISAARVLQEFAEKVSL